ncbi:HBS1-like protein [Actinia tenebrosa]|uniref:HBS1-like protein n=1 Tax=Actinia tenebrosa TaxID=6105 RepID=A0A6P8HLL4_ACTTE|nr:HBS1-like protein [Actinia tenebrosa]
MSRHRNVRNYAYEDEMSEDVYGHSVEEHDMCVSPSTAQQFMYNRGNDNEQSNLFSNYMSGRFGSVEEEEEEEQLEEEDHLSNSQDYRRPQLDPISEAKLSSCLDQLQSILGDDCHEPTAVDAILKFNFDAERALDYIFSKENKKESSQKKTPKKQDTASYVPPDSTTARPRVPEQPVTVAAAAASNLPDFFSKNVVSRLNHSSSASSTKRSQSSNVVIGFSTPVSPKSRSSSSSPDNTQTASEVDAFKSPEQQKAKPAKQIDAQAEYEKRQQGKDLLNLVVIGHVDAGKSTLMGHMLFLLGDVSKKAMHKYETESKKAGKASFAYAWVLDETGEERERGITMDVGLTRFATKSKVITLMDAPGHKDFIPNMITGAAQADVAILVVDSSTGEFEAGFEAGGQTREHALLVRSLGVTQIVVAVNKLDNVDWSEERYLYIVGKLRLFLKQVGFKDSDVGYVPCSGLSGENLVKQCTEDKLKKWYKGPCLLDRIDDFKPPKRDMDKPWRFCVSDVYKGLGAGINLAGKMVAGSVQNGNRALVMPVGVKGMVKALTLHDEPKTWACAGDHVTLSLAGVDAIHVGVGSILCDPSFPVKSTTKIKARIIVFNIDIPITRGFMVLFHYQTMSEPASVKKLLALLNKSTGEVVKRKPRCLTKNSNAEVEIHTSRPVCVELYKDYKDLGRFMLRYGNETIAAGVITAVL